MQIDPDRIPPPLLTSEPGSFAHETLKTRVPHIVHDTIALNAFPSEIRTALEDLHAELTAGRIRSLREAAPDAALWNALSRPYLGRTWLDVPWLWAEAYFYRRLLEATRYFQRGPWHGVDPFRQKKREDLAAHAAPRLVDATLRALPTDAGERFHVFLSASLWGNRIDLSLPRVSEMGRAAGLGHVADNVLVNDAPAVWEYLRSRRCRRIIVVADNAGTEVLMDLALTNFLIAEGLVGEVAFHLKAQPFFVSDAMPADIDEALVALASGPDTTRRLAESIRRHIDAGTIRFRTHWVSTTSRA